MTNKGENTLKEILSQPTVWAETLEVFKENTPKVETFWKDDNYELVIFTGCGSTFYLSQTAAVIFQKYTGVQSIALPGSELSLFSDIYFDKNKKTLLVAVSRSGETSETIHAIELFKEGKFGKVLAVTTVPDSSVNKLADLNLIAESAQEKSIAQTRSFASMLLLIEALSLQIGGENAVEVLNDFPKIVESLFSKYSDIVKEIGNDALIDRIFYLGSAYNYGIASEAMLKMKEMSISNSEAFHTLEFRHGPKSMVDEHALIIGLVSESIRNQEIPVLEEMAAYKGKILAIAEEKDPRLEKIGNVIELGSKVSEPVRALLFLPMLQLLAFHRSIARGQNPDKPQNLDAVVQIPSISG